MTNFLTNLIKLSDYPFIYSLGALWLTTKGNQLTLDDLSDLTVIGPILSIIGIIGTILAITDPVGNSLRRILMIKPPVPISRDHKYGYQFTRAASPVPPARQAISSNWISYEIDKIVSEIYFTFILLVIAIALLASPYYSNFIRICIYRFIQ